MHSLKTPISRSDPNQIIINSFFSFFQDPLFNIKHSSQSLSRSSISVSLTLISFSFSYSTTDPITIPSRDPLIPLSKTPSNPFPDHSLTPRPINPFTQNHPYQIQIPLTNNSISHFPFSHFPFPISHNVTIWLHSPLVSSKMVYSSPNPPVNTGQMQGLITQHTDLIDSFGLDSLR